MVRKHRYNTIKDARYIPEIMTRDNYKCIDCGKEHSIKKPLIVHHIDENRKNNDPLNLVTLCYSCHAIRHGREKVQHPEVIKLRNFGLTFQEIGEMLGVSRQRAFQLVKIH